jgi:hypothetical protein
MLVSGSLWLAEAARECEDYRTSADSRARAKAVD